MYDWPPILGSDNTPLANPLKRTPNCKLRIVRDGNQEPAMTLTPEQTDVDRIIAGLSETQKRAMERGRRYIKKIWREPKPFFAVRDKLEAENG